MIFYIIKQSFLCGVRESDHVRSRDDENGCEESGCIDNRRIVMSKNKEKKYFAKIFAAASLGSGIFIAMGWPFFRFMTYAGKKKTEKQSTNRKKWFQLKHPTINHPRHNYEEEYLSTREWCENMEMKDVFIRSVDGLKLHASFLPAENAKRIVILCHGYRGTRFGSVAHVAHFLHDENSGLLFIDQRCCGESEGRYITFGAREQYDILEWVKLIEKKNHKHLPIYLYGQSMGAASVILASGHTLPKDVKDIIADCGFHSMKQQLRDIASGWFHLHWIELLLMRVDLFCRLFGGFAMKETDMTEALKKNDVPILFFHGEDDTYVFPENTRRNYKLCRADKELVIIPGARHLCCSYVEPELYINKMREFIDRTENTEKR